MAKQDDDLFTRVRDALYHLNCARNALKDITLADLEAEPDIDLLPDTFHDLTLGRDRLQVVHDALLAAGAKYTGILPVINED